MRLWVTHSTDRLAESTEKQAKKNQLYSSYFMFVPYLPSIEVKKNAGNWLWCWRFPTILSQQSFHSHIFHRSAAVFFFVIFEWNAHSCMHVWVSNLKNCLEKVQFHFRKMQYIACHLHTCLNTRILFVFLVMDI